METKANGGTQLRTLSSYVEPPEKSTPILEEEIHPMRKSNLGSNEDETGDVTEILLRIERQLDSQRRVIENRPEPKSQATAIIGVAVAVLVAVLAVGAYIVSITQSFGHMEKEQAVQALKLEQVQKERDADAEKLKVVERDNKSLNQLYLIKFGKPAIPANNQ